jgi:hypothetical protein
MKVDFEHRSDRPLFRFIAGKRSVITECHMHSADLTVAPPRFEVIDAMGMDFKQKPRDEP